MAVTMKGMCEVIARHWEELCGLESGTIDPEKIFNYSSTGELHMVFSWYNRSKSYFDAKIEKSPSS